MSEPDDVLRDAITQARQIEDHPDRTVRDDLTPAWAEHDLQEFGTQARGLRLDVLAQRTFTTPFDLSSESPLRITLVRTGSDEHVLLLAAHHIAWEDASWRVFLADLKRAYQHEVLPPAPPADSPTTVHAGSSKPPASSPNSHCPTSLTATRTPSRT